MDSNNSKIDNNHVNENEKQIEKQNNKENLPPDAITGGFTDLNEWNLAQLEGIHNLKDFRNFMQFKEAGISKENWLKIKKAGFSSYEEWLNANNEGFDKREDWEEWKDLKNSGFVDIDLYYETKNIGFMQKNLRKSFLELLRMAKKAGFDSYLTWKEAKKFNIETNQDWQLYKEFSFQSSDEFVLFKELHQKITNLLKELHQNQEIAVNRIIELIDEEYGFNHQETFVKQIVYKNFTREKFEEILQKSLRYEASNNAEYRFSRLTNSFSKTNVAQFVSGTPKIQTTDFKCPNCFNTIPKTSSFCPECGLKLEKCPICQTIMEDNTVGSCPHCERKFHLNHLKETVKVYGKCPVCKNDLKDYEVI